jgi:hypothetical protein
MEFDWGDRSQEAELHRYYGIPPSLPVEGQRVLRNRLSKTITVSPPDKFPDPARACLSGPWVGTNALHGLLSFDRAVEMT